MPISRFQVRNANNLAEPDLYRAAYRDDPGEMLESVTMAGFVGILRQLGDLSEFAADIFHDLHDAVTVTAARGHGLLIRVQHLEAEFPLIEKAFLSQTNHSHFTYNQGIKWHANIPLDQNFITQGDRPRFIMESYEECRGPPRVFLLDKFDIVGAGACLKRYTDPSMFKTGITSSAAKKVEIKREKRTSKSKGTPWWNEDPPEIFTASHFSAKLHQFISIQNNSSEKISTHGVKLKRRNLKSTTGKSYMEDILEMNPLKLSPEVPQIGMEYLTNRIFHKEKKTVLSSDRKEVYEQTVDELEKNISNNELVGSNQVPNTKYEIQEITYISSKIQSNVLINGESTIENEAKVYGSDEFEMKKIPSTFQLVDQNDVLNDRRSMAASKIDVYRSEETAIVLKNYMDALTNMESEMETANDSKVKDELGLFNAIGQAIDSDLNYEPNELQAQFSDSSSVDNSSAASSDWNGLLERERLDCSISDNLSNSVDFHPSQDNGTASNMSDNSAAAQSIHLPLLYPNSSSNALLCSSDILNLPHGMKAFLEKATPIEYDEDCSSTERLMVKTIVCMSDCPPETDICNPPATNGDATFEKARMRDSEDGPGVENLMSRTLDSSKSMEELPHILIKQNHDACAGKEKNRTFQQSHSANVCTDLEIENCSPPTGNSELLSSASSLQVSDDFRKFVPEKIIMGISSHESENLSDVEPPDSHVDTFGEHSLQYSGNGALVSDNLESFGASKSMVKDEPLEGGNLLKNIMESGSTHVDLLALPMISNCYQVDALHMGTCRHSDDVELGFPFVETSLDDGLHEPFSSLEVSEHIKSQDDCFLSNTATDLCGLHRTESSDSKDFIGLENGLNPPICGSTILDTPCSPYLPDSSGFHGSAYHPVSVVGSTSLGIPCTPVSPDSSVSPDSNDNSKIVTSMTKSDQESKLSRSHDSHPYKDGKDNSPSTTFIPEQAVTSEHALELQPGTDLSSVFEYEVGISPNCFDLLLERARSPEQLGCLCASGEGCIQSPSSHAFDNSELPKIPYDLKVSSATTSQEYLKSPAAITSKQALKLHAGMDLSTLSKCEEGSSPTSSVLQFKIAQSTESLGFPGHSEGYIRSPIRHEFDSSELPKNKSDFNIKAAITSEKSLKVRVDMEIGTVHDEGKSSESCVFQTRMTQSTEKLGFPHDSRERSIPSLVSHKLDSSKLLKRLSDSNIPVAPTSICPGFGLPILETTEKRSFEQELNQTVLGYPLPDTNALQTNLEEMAPLPPLPPLEWRIGNLIYGSIFSGAEKMHFDSSFPPLPTTENQNHQQLFSTAGREIPCFVNSSVPSPTGEHQDISQILDSAIPQPPNSCTPLTVEDEKPQHGFQTSREQKLPARSLSAPLATVEEDEKYNKPQDFSHSIEVAKLQNLTSYATPPIVDEKVQNGSFALGGEMKWTHNPHLFSPTIEYGNPNGKYQSKPTQLRYPLVEPLASHHRTMLRNVSERVRPPKADERDSFLEQIRSKSFNLRPAVKTKPAIQGPRTNLNVVAILEKANSIRHAFVGSDDEDDWSDS